MIVIDVEQGRTKIWIELQREIQDEAIAQMAVCIFIVFNLKESNLKHILSTFSDTPSSRQPSSDRRDDLDTERDMFDATSVTGRSNGSTAADIAEPIDQQFERDLFGDDREDEAAEDEDEPEGENLFGDNLERSV